MIKKLSHICLGSTNLEKTINFYQEYLNAKVVHEFKKNNNEIYGVFLLVGDGTFLEFFEEQSFPPKAPSLFRHLCFEVKNISDFANKLRKDGFDVTVQRGKTDGILQCWISDVDGNHIEFQQHDKKSVLLPYITKNVLPDTA